MSTNKVAKRVGFLATGSEITTGEIINTNSQMMAEHLQDYGIHVGEHLICDDNCLNIEESLEFMLKRHDAVVITGGLGPTSDDCTRDVVAKLAGQKLVFNQAVWDSIVARLSKRNLPISENNRQQAYFPTQANVLANAFGTAAGCHLTIGKTLVFLLPGPPRECIPLFNEYVLPLLLKEHFATDRRLFRWRLMGVSESKIAEMLEPIAQKYKLDFAYRAHYPFTDIKLFIEPQTKQHTKILLEVEALVRPYFVTHLNQLMSKQLIEHLSQSPKHIYLDDQATKGALKQALLTSGTENCFVGKNTKADLEVYLSGLNEYWEQNQDNTMVELTLELRQGHKHAQFKVPVLLRGKETLLHAIEFTCWKILGFL